MASKITIFFLLALVVACTMMVRIPTVDAEVVLPCKTTDDCENLPCSGDECEYLPC
ncbi:unnamed protein product [Arabidopsis halleri]